MASPRRPSKNVPMSSTRPARLLQELMVLARHEDAALSIRVQGRPSAEGDVQNLLPSGRLLRAQAAGNSTGAAPQKHSPIPFGARPLRRLPGRNLPKNFGPSPARPASLAAGCAYLVWSNDFQAPRSPCQTSTRPSVSARRVSATAEPTGRRELRSGQHWNVADRPPGHWRPSAPSVVSAHREDSGVRCQRQEATGPGSGRHEPVRAERPVAPAPRASVDRGVEVT